MSKRDGKSNRLDIIANKSVIETREPNATVPPKFETINTEKPKNKTIDV